MRITNKLDIKTKELIKKEFEIHKKNKILNDFSLEFVCYYFSPTLNFSVFIIKDNKYYTLEEIIENKNIDQDIEFSKEELILATTSSIENLYQEQNCFICPFLTPYNLIYTELSTKEYFLFSEIFLETDSPEKEIEIELCNKNLKD